VTTKIPMTFQIFQGEDLVRTERLVQDIIKVGKLPSSHLRLDDDNVSRMHAVIEVTGPDEVFIIDLGSASGTIVNGKKVNKTKLQSGDEIRLGGTRVVIEIGKAESVESPSTPASAPASTAHSAPPPPAPAAVAPNPFALGAGGALPNPFAPPPSLGSPFAPPAAAPPVASVPTDPEQVRYGIVASGPPVRPDEVETGASAIEVVVMWGDNSVLHTAHLSPPREFTVGDETTGKGKPATDYLIGSEVLGMSRLPVVTPVGDGIAVVVPPGATGEVTVGDQSMSIADLAAQGRLRPSTAVAGAQEYVLPPNATARVHYKGFTFLTRPVHAGKPVGVGRDSFRGSVAAGAAAYLWVGISLLVHGSFLVLMYFMPPSSSSLSLELLTADNRYAKYLIEPPETREEEQPEWLNQENKNEEEGGKGKRHKGEEGQMGKNDAKKTKNRYGIEGPADNPDPHMAREQAREQARTAGILGVLRASTGAWNSPTSPFGRDTALGNDPMSALGALMGDQIGENFGFGGLGLRGTGRGGGGTGEGTIGLGNLGTIGHGGGGGDGNGYGRGAGGFSGRTARVPRIRAGNADVRGSLSKEVIRRVIQRHINEVRFCYEQQLNQRPDLAGRVVVQFVISPTGAVQMAAVSQSDMNSPPTEQCIASAVQRWSFPAPEGGGIVVVNYPFVLQATGGGEGD
jgi:pSer/pThr/pTyr-binding forkhead associated (FHA) protein